MPSSSPPDIETASEDYDRRFAGPVGAYFLDRQAAIVGGFLKKYASSSLRALEVGGGHAQLTPTLLGLGHRVTVHGSDSTCSRKLPSLMARYSRQLEFREGSLESLPFEAASFDCVIAIRLMAHVESPQALLQELSRVSKKWVIIDFAPLESFNILTPLMFRLKKRVEKNTRPYQIQSRREIDKLLSGAGLRLVQREGQFVLPMGLHRAMKRPRLTGAIESILARTGAARGVGSPTLLLAEKIPATS